MNSKLPHERLREWADESEKNDTYPSGWLIGCLLEDTYNVPVEECERKAFRKLADEVEGAIESAYMDGTCHYFDMIAEEQGWPKRKADELVEDYVKRCFFPRPRFDDGEPVQFHDSVRAENIVILVEEIAFTCRGWHLRNGLRKSLCGNWETPVKRPAPKVLDADGVPIEVGDAVYTEAGLRRYVAKVGTERCLGMEDWDGSPWVMFGNGSWMHAHDITHREPDSLRKLRDDMRGYADGGVSCIEDDMRMFADRLTALMEGGAE